MKRITCLLAAIASTSLALAANPEQPIPSFADVFGNSMVLPHGVPLTLSGQAAPRQRLALQVEGSTYRFRADSQGQWRTTIRPLHSGGPYTLALKNEQGAGTTLSDVLAGEVWLCSGQSNMEFAVERSTDQPDDVQQGHPEIRLFTVPQQTALQPRKDFDQNPSWLIANTENVRRFSALCYFFAHRKVAEAGVPIGLVNASWGGAAIEAWIGEARLATWPAYRSRIDLLRQYRVDPRSAEVAFAGEWVKWWLASSTLGAVWEKGILDDRPDWKDAPLRDWRTYPDTSLQNLTGSVWFSTSFELTEAQSRRGAHFVLGKVDEVDCTWLNGQFVGNTFGYGTRREYVLDPGMLKAGVNQVSAMVTSTYGAGGIYGPEADIGIRFDDGEFVPLGARWKYRAVPKQTPYPPRAPWESVAGLAGMFNAMIAPLQSLVPTGVIWYQGESNVDKSGDYAVLLPGLIRNWRDWFGSELPFIIVQLPNYGAIARAPVESGWANLRNIQQQVALRDDRVGLVVTQDLGDDADLHPRKKYSVASRALQVAHALNTRGTQDGIVPGLAAMTSDSLVLEFSPALAARPDAASIAGFSLCGTVAGSCVVAQATQRGSRVEISRKSLPEATRLRYCWSDGGTCELRSPGAVPVGSFELPLRPARR